MGVAEATKNFSGAELEGLINSAASFALERSMLPASARARAEGSRAEGEGGVEVPPLSPELRVTMEDFTGALRDVSPQLGTRAAHLTVRSHIVRDVFPCLHSGTAAQSIRP